MKPNTFLALLCLLVSPSVAFGMGLEEFRTTGGVSLDLVTYDVEIDDQFATATMELNLVNDDDDDGTANVRFPLPPGAVLYRAEIQHGGEWLMAATQGRREAEATYQDDPEQDQRPLLVQRIGLDFYRARVKLDPGATSIVRIHYAQPLERTPDGLAARIAVANPDSTPAAPTRGLKATFRYTSEAWADVNWVRFPEDASPSARLETASLGMGSTRLDTDMILELEPAEPSDLSAVRYAPEGRPHHLFARWYPTIDHPSTFAGNRNVVFVVDGSGSMSGRKIDETKKVLKRALNQMRPEDRWGLLVFHGTDTYAARTEMAHGDDLAGADGWIDDLRTNGGTGLYYALEHAVRIGATSDLDSPTDIVVLTDGLPNQGPTSVPEIIAGLTDEADEYDRTFRIFALAIGHNLDQNFINELVHKTDGEATFALDDAEITGQFFDLFDRVRTGGVHDVEATVSNGSVDESYTRVRMFDGDAIDFGAEFEAANELAFHFEGTTPVAVVETDDAELEAPPQRPYAAPLAGKALADRLERRIDERGESDDLVVSAVVLAKRYGIVTRYSGFVAAHDLTPLRRDEAGIALDEIDPSLVFEEARIGGAGTVDAGGSEAQSCSTTGGRGAGAWLLLLAAAIGLRRRRS